jgi:rhodanese-related sulfurtransferase
MLIDARDGAHYEKGHIPGAWQFDHYHAEQYLPTILPGCMNAQKVVVYCNGGACEDSEFAAILLREAGVPRERLFVYAGGISEWADSGRLVETGMRRSGQLVKPKP